VKIVVALKRETGIYSALVMSKAKAPSIKDPITTVEAGEILALDPSAIRHRILKKKLAGEKRGRDWYVSRSTIEAERDAKKRKNGKK
jgi:hypothetical protein